MCKEVEILHLAWLYMKCSNNISKLFYYIQGTVIFIILFTYKTSVENDNEEQQIKHLFSQWD